jgi:hypothetical protein
MAARPEEDYSVQGALSDPFTALNKAEKKIFQQQAQARKEEEKKAKELEAKAEKEAKKEEARKAKELALAEKIKKRTSENEARQIQEQQKRELERIREEEKRQAEEMKKASDRERAALKQKKDEEEAKQRLEKESLEQRLKLQTEKESARKKRDDDLKKEEELADKRAADIAATRSLQQRIEEAKRLGKLPENFIPVVWGSSDAARKEMEDLLERPYWDDSEAPPKGAKRQEQRHAPSEVVKSSLRTSDEWLDHKRSQQGSVPWTQQLWKSVSQPSELPPPKVRSLLAPNM